MRGHHRTPRPRCWSCQDRFRVSFSTLRLASSRNQPRCRVSIGSPGKAMEWIVGGEGTVGLTVRTADNPGLTRLVGRVYRNAHSDSARHRPPLRHFGSPFLLPFVAPSLRPCVASPFTDTHRRTGPRTSRSRRGRRRPRRCWCQCRTRTGLLWRTSPQRSRSRRGRRRPHRC